MLCTQRPSVWPLKPQSPLTVFPRNLLLCYEELRVFAQVGRLGEWLWPAAEARLLWREGPPTPTAGPFAGVYAGSLTTTVAHGGWQLASVLAQWLWSSQGQNHSRALTGQSGVVASLVPRRQPWSSWPESSRLHSPAALPGPRPCLGSSPSDWTPAPSSHRADFPSTLSPSCRKTPAMALGTPAWL